MSNEYASHLLDASVAQVCKTIGWTNTHISALQHLSHFTERYLRKLAELAKDFAELNNRTTPNMDDLAFVFTYLRIDLEEMVEYCGNVEPLLPFDVRRVSIPNGKKLNAIDK